MKCKKGYKRKGKRCVRLSYNPFKMIGSWIGSVVLYLSILIFGIDYSNFFYSTIWQRVLHLPPIDYSVIILTSILGFFIGWGIHSLIRRLK